MFPASPQILPRDMESPYNMNSVKHEEEVDEFCRDFQRSVVSLLQMRKLSTREVKMT
jgi:hypothetical protein